MSDELRQDVLYQLMGSDGAAVAAPAADRDGRDDADDYIPKSKINRYLGILGVASLLAWETTLLASATSPFYPYLADGPVLAQVGILAAVIAIIFVPLPLRFDSAKRPAVYALSAIAILAAVASALVPIPAAGALFAALAIRCVKALWRQTYMLYFDDIATWGMTLVASAVMIGLSALASVLAYPSVPLVVLPAFSVLLMLGSWGMRPSADQPAQGRMPVQGDVSPDADDGSTSSQDKLFSRLTTSASALMGMVDGSMLSACLFGRAAPFLPLAVFACSYAAYGALLVFGAEKLKEREARIAIGMMAALLVPQLVALILVPALPASILGATGAATAFAIIILATKALTIHFPLPAEKGRPIIGIVLVPLGIYLGILLGIALHPVGGPAAGVMYGMMLWICALILGGYFIMDIARHTELLKRAQHNPAGTSSHTDGSWERKIQLTADKYKFTPRQREVMHYLARGRNAEHIANAIFVTEATAKSHIYSIYRKLHVHNQQELMNLVHQQRLPDADGTKESEEENG